MMQWYFMLAGVLIEILTLVVSLLVFLGEPTNPFRRFRPSGVVVVCAAISVAVMLLGLVTFPAGWLLANMASFVGIKVGFGLPVWLACLVFFVNFVLFQSFLWFVGPVFLQTSSGAA